MRILCLTTMYNTKTGMDAMELEYIHVVLWSTQNSWFGTTDRIVYDPMTDPPYGGLALWLSRSSG